MQNLKRKSSESENKETKKKKSAENIKTGKVVKEKKFSKNLKSNSKNAVSKKSDGEPNTEKRVKSNISNVHNKKSINPKKGKDGSFIKDKQGKFKKGKDFNKNKGDFKKGKPGAPTEKPIWSEMKKQKKELRLERRKAKATATVFELSHKAKGLSAQIQRKVTSTEVRGKLCQELHGLLKGQYPALALAHDLSRVIQVLLKHSSEDIRDEITTELLPIIVQMIQSKYAHHSVKRILKYGSDGIRRKVIDRLMGSIVTLAAHTISAPILDYAYSEHATNNQKIFMQQEFYGDMYKNTKDSNVKCLSDTYKNSPEMKDGILNACKSNIQRILDKNLHDGELMHSVLYQYMCECSAEERGELVTTLSPLIVPLSNSLPGVNAACLCVWHGTNKDKKTILKVVKEHAVALSTHKTGYRLLIAIFHSVDDTVLVKKTVVSAIVKDIKNIAKDHWGKMTLHWLVKPCDPAAFHPTFVKQLKDGASSGLSKKDPEIRAAELREAVMPALSEEIAADPAIWICDATMGLLTVTVVSAGVTQEAMSALASAICRPDWTLQTEGKSVAGIEDAGMHVCLKKMAARDKDSVVKFGDSLAEHLTDETLKAWLATNRGCFLLVKTIESNEHAVASKLVEKIKPHSKLLQSQNTQGAKILLKKIV